MSRAQFLRNSFLLASGSLIFGAGESAASCFRRFPRAAFEY